MAPDNLRSPHPSDKPRNEPIQQHFKPDVTDEHIHPAADETPQMPAKQTIAQTDEYRRKSAGMGWRNSKPR